MNENWGIILKKAQTNTMANVKTPANMNDPANLNAMELTSIKALLAYTAYDRQVSEAIVNDLFSTRFGIDKIEKLRQTDYENAIRYLIDLQVDMVQ